MGVDLGSTVVEPRRSQAARRSVGARPSQANMAARPSEMSVNINMNEKPGDYVCNLFEEQQEQAPEAPSGLSGTFAGVYMPTCLMMWGVIIFVRFGEVTGEAGIGMAIFSALLSAAVVGLTASSVSALASNGVQSGAGGVYHLLTRSLGPSIGGATSLLYFFGLTVMSTVEVVGFTEAIRGIVEAETGKYVTGSSYLDQLAYGPSTYLVMLLFTYLGQKFTHTLGMVFLVILACAYLAAFAGLFGSLAGWAVGEHYEAYKNETYVITGLRTDTFLANMSPDYSDHYNFNVVMAFVFPCFICIFKGANNAHLLATPNRSIPVGTFGAIATSFSFYTLIFCLLGAVAPRETLKHYFLLFEDVAWPNRWVTIAGLLVVALSACLELLQVAPNVLRSIAAEDIIPVLRIFGFEKVNERGLPTRALLCTGCIAFPFLFVPNLDFIATIVTMLFLLNYAAVNLSCFLMSALHAPSWRPRFRYYHKYFTALAGFLLSMSIMFMIQWIVAFCATIAFLLLTAYIEMKGTSGIWGHGVKGLQMHLALHALTQAEQESAVAAYARFFRKMSGDSGADVSLMSEVDGEGSESKPKHTVSIRSEISGEGLPDTIDSAELEAPGEWRPQVLVMVPMAEDTLVDDTGRRLLDFTRMLTKSCAKGSLIIAASVLPRTHTDGAGAVSLRLKKRKAVLQSNLMEHKLEGFVEVISAPSTDVGTSILLQTAGLGCLKPNTIISAWPDQASAPYAAKSTLSLIAQARADNKAMLMVKGVETFPSVSAKATGCIDIWWVLQEGGLLLLVGHLLRQHKTWRSCRLRLFTVARPETNSVLVEKRLKALLEALRIMAQVHVVELQADLGAFTADFTVTKNLLDAPRRPATHIFPSCVDELARPPSSEAMPQPNPITDSSETAMLNTTQSPMLSIPCASHASLPSPTHPSPLATQNDNTSPSDSSTPTTPTTPTTPRATHAHNVTISPCSTHLTVPLKDSPSRPRKPNRRFEVSRVETTGGGVWDQRELKEAMERESTNSALVILNLPVPNRDALQSAEDYIHLVDNLTEKLPRCVLAHGLGDGTQVLSVFNH